MTEKIFHHNDADGRCAGAIAAQYCAEAETAYELIELDYKDRVPVEKVKAGDIVFVLDFSFKPETMKYMRSVAASVIWCDHHVTAMEYGYGDVKGLRDFSEKGLSGCELTWLHLYPELPMPRFVSLIGDYDAWRLRFAPESFEFYEGLKMYDTSAGCGLWRDLLNGSIPIQDITRQGQIAIKYRDSYCEEMRKGFAYETFIGDQSALAMNVAHFGSKQFAEEFDKYPVCIAYVHDGYNFTVSLYSKTVDVSAIAKRYGGGGHKGAAGFVCTALPFYRRFERLDT